MLVYKSYYVSCFILSVIFWNLLYVEMKIYTFCLLKMKIYTFCLLIVANRLVASVKIYPAFTAEYFAEKNVKQIVLFACWNEAGK